MSSFSRNLFYIPAIILSLIGITAQSAEPPKYSLSSIVGEGVQGNLATSTEHFTQGTAVPYAFTPAPGYSSAIVVIDGVVAPASGTVTMNNNRWLWAFGNPEGGTQFSGMMTAPADFTRIPYPEFYQQRPSFDFSVVDPYCALTSDVVAYPSAYAGSFPLPPVHGAPLSPTVRRGAGVKDYWEFGLTNPSTNQGCSGDIHEAFLATLERLKKLGIDHVIVYRDAAVVDANANQLQFIYAVPWSISDSEMAWIVAQARTFGLQVHEHRQINNVDMNNVPLPTTPTQAWASNYLDAYTQYIVDRARVAQQNGVEAFLLDWGVYWFDWTPYKDLFISKMTSAAQQVRSVYSGKILYGKVAPWISGNTALLNSIDWFVGELWGATINNMTSAENANLTVPLLKQKYLNLMTGLANALGPIRKPMAWGVFAQSHRNYLLNGWVEDGFCVNGCSQQSIQIDFSVQAIAYEAMLEAIAEQTLFTTASVDAYAYWYVDVMLPKDSFPNLSQSWRNKPAESILYRWFRRPTTVDFDDNGTSDIVVHRNGAWLFHNFNTGAQTSGVWTGGGGNCIPVAMDYNGDGKTDFTQFCNGAWHFYNANGAYNKGIWTGGVAGDRPVPADYDGDGTDDVVVYRGGAWLFFTFATGAFDAAKSKWTGGGGSCIPAPMDYNGDGKKDFTQLCSGAWHFYNGNGSYNKGIWTGGAAGDLPVPADYDANGTDEVVVFRGGAWLFYDFATGAFDAVKSTWTGAPPHWTGGTSLPAPLDYDGDGKVDFTVYSGGPWHFFNGNGTYNKGIWTGGVAGDKALSRRLLP
jgi:FG-GAP-like repeat